MRRGAGGSQRKGTRRSSPPSASPRSQASLLWLAALLGATALAYQPVWHGGLLWDDKAHLIAESLQGWNGLWRLWSDPAVSQQYYPISSTAFWIMARAFGADTFGYHILNIVLHATSAFMVTVILNRLRVPGAMIAGAVFALHPVFVESVAWISELKNTLSGVLYLTAFWVYLRFDDTRTRGSYASALVLFVLALGAKTVTATMPAAMLVVLWWQRGRLDWRRDVSPLAPFFAIGIAAGLGTAWLEYAWVGAQGSRFELGLAERLLLPGRILWFYAWSLLWPSNLMFNYPRWHVDATAWWQYLYPVAFIGVLAAAFVFRRRSRAPLACLLFFAGTLFPVLGFLNVFPFRYSYVADHFQYLASLGVIAGVSAALATLVRQRWPRTSEALLAAIVAAPLTLMTFQYSATYVDAETLYRETIARNPASGLVRTNLAAMLLDGPESGWPEAATHVQAVLASDADNVPARNLYGLTLQRSGRLHEALAEFDRATALDPGLAEAHYNRGLTLAGLGRSVEAVAAYERALALFPKDARALHNLANVLRQLRRYDEALMRIRSAIAIDPATPELRLNLADTLLASGDAGAAVLAYQDAIARRPESGEAWNNLGLALRRTGRAEEARRAFENALRLLPDSPTVLANLGSVAK
jgi:Flp pilus assembly protein TadD